MTISDDCQKRIMNLMSTFIKPTRKGKNLTQDEVAFLTFHTRNCIQQLERGKHLPDFETFFLLIGGLQLSEEEAVRLFLEICSCVKQDMEELHKQAGTQSMAEWLWSGKPTDSLTYAHV